MVTITKYLNYTIGVPERFVDTVSKELKDLSINPKSINSMITHIEQNNIKLFDYMHRFECPKGNNIMKTYFECYTDEEKFNEFINRAKKFNFHVTVTIS